MNTLFLILLLVSLLGLVIGIIKPSLVKMPSRKRAGLVLGAAVLVFFVLFGVTINSNSIEETNSMRFDVPSLVGKDVEGVAEVLGPANKDNVDPTPQQLVIPQELEMKTIEWSKTWEKDGQDLLVTYDFKTGKIIDFFLPTTEPDSLTKDKSALLKAGNLKQNDKAYKIEFVQAQVDDGYTGVKITPNK